MRKKIKCSNSTPSKARKSDDPSGPVISSGGVNFKPPTLSSTFAHLRSLLSSVPPPHSFPGSIQCWVSPCPHCYTQLSLYSCRQRSRPLGWLTSKRSWDARYVRDLGMIVFQNPSIPVGCAPYIEALLTLLLLHRSVQSYSTNLSHFLTACTPFADPA